MTDFEKALEAEAPEAADKYHAVNGPSYTSEHFEQAFSLGASFARDFTLKEHQELEKLLNKLQQEQAELVELLELASYYLTFQYPEDEDGYETFREKLISKLKAKGGE